MSIPAILKIYLNGISATKFKGLKVISGKVFYDNRGFFKEIYKSKLLNSYRPTFWCASKSKKGVLRGLHLQKKICKLNL